MLQLQQVSKLYTHRHRQTCALDNVSLRITPGEFVAVVGPSGSGKSTLLLMLGGMLSPTSGRVFIEGKSVYEVSAEERAAIRRQKLGFVFQTFNLVPYLSAIENVQVPLLLADMPEASQKEVAARMLNRVGLGDRCDHKPSELSVGQQQRVALARMLANDPAIILADEPTGNLDPDISRQILDFFAAVNREGKTVVMVTHDMRAARRAGRILRIVDGKIAPGKPPDADAECMDPVDALGAAQAL